MIGTPFDTKGEIVGIRLISGVARSRKGRTAAYSRIVATAVSRGESDNTVYPMLPTARIYPGVANLC